MTFDKDYWEQHWQQGARATPTAMEQNPPNPYLVNGTSNLTPGTALDAGCGAGAEAIWLASQGWQVTAADISRDALDKAIRREANTGLSQQANGETTTRPSQQVNWETTASLSQQVNWATTTRPSQQVNWATTTNLSQQVNWATTTSLSPQVNWLEADLTVWTPDTQYDLVTTHYAHPTIPQLAFYNRISTWVAPRGTLLIVGHLHTHNTPYSEPEHNQTNPDQSDHQRGHPEQKRHSDGESEQAQHGDRQHGEQRRHAGGQHGEQRRHAGGQHGEQDRHDNRQHGEQDRHGDRQHGDREHGEQEHGEQDRHGHHSPAEASVALADITAGLDNTQWEIVAADEHVRTIAGPAGPAGAAGAAGRTTELHDVVVQAIRRA